MTTCQKGTEMLINSSVLSVQVLQLLKVLLLVIAISFLPLSVF